MADVTRVAIEKLGQFGDGLVAAPEGGNGAPRFVAGALPGEIWDLAEAAPPRLVTPHAERQPDRCPHFGRCGGCMAHHMPPTIYAHWKREMVVGALAQHGIGAEVVGPLVTLPAAGRRRAVLTAERHGAGFVLGFREAASHRLEAISACAVLVPAIVSQLPALADLAAVMLSDADAGRLVVLATEGGLDVSLVEPSVRLNAKARAAIAELARRSRIARVSVGREPLVTLAPPLLNFGGVAVTPPPGAFVQAAAAAEAVMADLVVAGTGRSKVVADLFAGLGTFTVPLARKSKVVAIDTAADALAALTSALRGASGVKPVETRVRDLLREPLSPKELAGFDAVVFDPPRAGAKAQAERLARSTVARVVAVSCNPATLARDLEILIAGGYVIEAVTPVDQFVFSAHVEAVATLRKA